MNCDMLPKAFIDLDALIANYQLLCKKAFPAEVGAVVKADAYGLGLDPVSKALTRAGCKTFFTSHYSEALELQRILPESRIVVLHGIAEHEITDAISRNIIPVINYLGALEVWKCMASRVEKQLPVYIHLDTGMNRLGMEPDEQKRLVENPELLEGLAIEGWISHLACADDFSCQMTTEQRNRFLEVLKLLPRAPASLCNSSGIFWGRDYVFDLVRPGIALYGGNPVPHQANPMKPVLELWAPIIQVRSVDTEMTIGYGAGHRFNRRGRVATLALGYADGYHRFLGERGTVMIKGYPAPLIGRISMDLITVDVTDVPEQVVYPGAMAVLIGDHRSIDKVAREGGTISYEILTSLGTRVERIYQKAEAA